MAAAALAVAHRIPEGAIAIVPIQTRGDRVQDRPLAEIGGKALWTRELDAALRDGRIDFAVHSMKDVETALAPGIALAAMLPRADPRDRLIGAGSVQQLPVGSTVGTSSPRRAAQLRNRRPDLTVAPLRGNVETRLRRIGEGDFAATFLAAAGLDRLGIAAGAVLELDDWLPAAAQGAVGITCRDDDEPMHAWLREVDHEATNRAVGAERALLAALGGSCHSAIAAHAQIVDTHIRLRAELLAPDGSTSITDEETFALADRGQLPLALADRLLARAGPGIRASLG